jgi:hypothetical protein
MPHIRERIFGAAPSDKIDTRRDMSIFLIRCNLCNITLTALAGKFQDAGCSDGEGE